MDKFIHRENLLLLKRRLADPNVTESQREVILRLMLEEQEKSQATPRAVIGTDQAHAHSVTAAAASEQSRMFILARLKQSLSSPSRP
jgi:hypothetical protein